MNATALSARLEAVLERVSRAADRSGRWPGAVRILPITKGHPPEMLHLVAEAGFEAIGENRVGEAEEKRTHAGKLDLRWHMVGHVQRNKAVRALRTFDAIDSVDSFRLGLKLSAEIARAGREVLPVLVQVNASGEATKEGFAMEEAVQEMDRICSLPGLEVRGLMTMAPYTSDEEILRHVFRRTRECLQRCRDEVAGFEGRTLSMGMSNDFEIAVEEGSTEIRLGTILLGERPRG